MKETTFRVRVVYNSQPKDFDNYTDYTFKSREKAHNFAWIITNAQEVYSASLYSYSVEEKLELTVRPDKKEEDEDDTQDPFVSMSKTYFEIFK